MDDNDLIVFTVGQVKEMIRECASNQFHGGFMAARALGNGKALVGNGHTFVLGDTIAWRDIHREA